SATGEVFCSGKNVSLPEAKNVQDIQMAPVVTITSTEVLLSGAPIGGLEALSSEPELDIPLLEERLRDEKKKLEDRQAVAGDPSACDCEVNVQADKSTAFRVLKRVMFSCASAGFGNINFATLNAGGGLPTGPPQLPLPLH